MSMIGRWLEEHGSELDALIAKIGRETGRLQTVEGVACDMLDQALEGFLGGVCRAVLLLARTPNRLSAAACARSAHPWRPAHA